MSLEQEIIVLNAKGVDFSKTLMAFTAKYEGILELDLLNLIFPSCMKLVFDNTNESRILLAKLAILCTEIKTDSHEVDTIAKQALEMILEKLQNEYCRINDDLNFFDNNKVIGGE